MCLDCGHLPQKDAQLMNGTLSIPHGCMVGLPGATSAGLRPPASAQTALVYDERMEQHVEGRHQPHPERPDRIRAVMARLLASGLASQCVRLPCVEAPPELLHTIHRPEFAYGEPANTHAYFTPDTYVNRYSSTCARLAAGGCAAMAAAVARGEAANGAAVVRPPGHHAESGTAMGFCFFNNAGIAAKAAQAAGASRILILDWDVHHGNGTQHIFEDDPSVLFMSLHRHDSGHFYPGTGDANEVGYGSGTGYTVNVAWPRAGMTDGDYLAAFMHIVLPIAYEYRPSLIIVSAGYDAALGDPIGGCRLTAEGPPFNARPPFGSACRPCSLPRRSYNTFSD
ncbi:hypothetical protein WJX84_011523 [Apatococcus fuscideae]|uniref:Histone deacetylase domain-containing protein n=1 Tax=Apatococcus fuscideae TaxID=2026836 RepID=A0AAW1T2N2_9CHLO